MNSSIEGYLCRWERHLPIPQRSRGQGRYFQPDPDGHGERPESLPLLAMAAENRQCGRTAAAGNNSMYISVPRSKPQSPPRPGELEACYAFPLRFTKAHNPADESR